MSSYPDSNTNLRPSTAPPGIAYTKVYAYADGNMIYEGWAKSENSPTTSSPVWAICKSTYTDGDLTMSQWADGNTWEDNVWDNRASLTYL